MSLEPSFYPFKTKISNQTVKDLIADVYVVSHATNNSNTVSADLHIDDISVTNNPSLALSVLILHNDADEVVFDHTAGSGTITEYGPWIVYEGKHETMIVKVLMRKEALDAETTVTVTDATDLILQNRNVEVVSLPVNNLQVDTGTLESATTGVTLQSGYNWQFNDIGDNQIEVNVIPGAGLGKNPVTCEDTDDPILRSLNGVTADEFGNLVVNTDNCYWWARTADDTLTLYGDCEVCYSCDDIENAYKRLMLLHTRASNLRTRLCNMITVYTDYVDLLNQFVSELDQTKGVITLTQTDLNVVTVQVNVQVGSTLDVGGDPMKITDVDLVITLSTDVTGTFIEYTGREKLPTRPAETFVPSAGGLELHYNRTPATTLLKPNTYAAWQWALDLDHPDTDEDGEEDITISATLTLTFEDTTTQVTNVTNEPFTIEIIDTSSDP